MEVPRGQRRGPDGVRRHRRVLAVALLIGGFLVFSLALGAASEALLRIVAIVYSTLVLVGVPAMLETVTRGRTLGKMALGPARRPRRRRPDTGRHALVRALVGYVEIYLLSVSRHSWPRWCIPGPSGSVTWRPAPSSSHSGRGCGSPHHRGCRPPSTPWARSADVAALPSGLTVAVRQFLARAPGLMPESRRRLGLDLLSRGDPPRQPATARRRPPRGSCSRPSWPSADGATSTGSGGRSGCGPACSRRTRSPAHRLTRSRRGGQTWAPSAAYPGLTTCSMISSRSSNGRNADFIALIVAQRRSSMAPARLVDEELHLAGHRGAAHESVVGVHGHPEAQRPSAA